MPVRNLVPRRTRWWCTAETASSDGTGTRLGPMFRSDRISTVTPSPTAAAASAQSRSTALANPSGPSETGQVQSSVSVSKT